MLVTRRVWILFLALPNHLTLRPGHLFCKMGISDLPLSAVLRNRWDYIFHSSSPAHMVLVIFLKTLWSFWALGMSHCGKWQGLRPEKVGKPEPTNWSLISPFPVSPDTSNEWLHVLHAMQIFSTLEAARGPDFPHQSAGGLVHARALDVAAAQPCRTLAVPLGENLDTGLGGIISFPLIFSMKKYLDWSPLRPQWKSRVSGRQGRECVCRESSRGDDELRADGPWALTLCQAPPCVHHVCHPRDSPSDSAQGGGRPGFEPRQTEPWAPVLNRSLWLPFT